MTKLEDLKAARDAAETAYDAARAAYTARAAAYAAAEDAYADARYAAEADSDLTPADAAVLSYLRGQVDRLQDERYRQNARPSIVNELQIAMRDLREFTSAKRQQGFNI